MAPRHDSDPWGIVIRAPVRHDGPPSTFALILDGNTPVRLVYVTASMPYGPDEAFLIPEVREILRQGCEILIVPRTPPRQIVHGDAVEFRDRCIAEPLFSWRILVSAIEELLRHPARAAIALGLLLQTRGLSNLLRNLAVFPKGLWLGALTRHWKADHVHAHWISTPATIALVASTVSGVPWSCTAHRVDIAKNNLLALKMSRAQFVRFISQSGRNMAASLGAPASSGKAIVIHLGITNPDREPYTGPPAAACNLLCPANLYPVKGHKYLIEAMSILRSRGIDCVLHIAGAGLLRPELEAIAGRLDLTGTVQFLGQLPHDEILDKYERHQIDVVVLPSIDLGNNLHEGIPIALVEAMANGIPVVATSTGGIPELLGEGAGVMAPPQDPVALADALQRLVCDPELRREIGEAGRRRVREAWSVESLVSDLLARIAEPRNT